MKPHPRIRKFFKWGGFVVSVLLLTTWIVSWWCHLIWILPNSGMVVVLRGRLMMQAPIGNTGSIRSEGLTFGSRPFEIEWGFLWQIWNGQRTCAIPLWCPALLAICLTLAAWRMDTLAQRRKRIGVCPACGYDRTGLAANAPCPECNAKA